jgi:glycosyltransferase involved in cell wall biosynthesis
VTDWVVVAGDFVRHGGMDRANLELARYLADRGRVSVVTHRADSDLAAHPNVTVRRVPRPLGRHLLGEPLLARAGWRAAKSGGRVVVNGGNCRWGDVNWVHCVHAAFPPTAPDGWVRRLKARWHHSRACRTEREALLAARIVVCNSRKTAADVVNRIGVPADRVRVVYLGVEAQQFPAVVAADRLAAREKLGWADRPWVGFVGQLGNRIKGFDTLFAAWVELCRDPRWDANLAVLGAGPEVPFWVDRAAAAGLAGRINFLGFRTDVPDVLAACDAVTHPARYDAYGLAPHEALCRGIPVVVSAAAGVAERFPAELTDLILTDPEDPGELADRLRHWRANVDMLTDRVQPFADELRRRTWTDMARDIHDLIERN